MLNGGQTVKTLSAVFLADLERHWRTHGTKVLDILAEKYPHAYFSGMVALSKVMRWETATDAGGFDRAMTPDENMDKLEKRVGPKGRKLFEQFLRKVNKLQVQQQLEAQARMRVETLPGRNMAACNRARPSGAAAPCNRLSRPTGRSRPR